MRAVRCGTRSKAALGPAGPASNRSRVDAARSARVRLLHEAHRRGLAAGGARRGPPRDAAWDGGHGGDALGRGRRVVALLRARARREGVDTDRIPAFGGPDIGGLGDVALEDVTPEMLERWKGSLTCSNRTTAKYLVNLHGIFRRAMKVWGLPRNPVAEVERPRTRVSDDLEAFSPEEVWALVRAGGSRQDGALFLTAAFTGLRMGSCWRSSGATSTSPARRCGCAGATTSRRLGRRRAARSGPCRSSTTLHSAGSVRRPRGFVGDDELLFPNDFGRFRTPAHCACATRRRSRAGLRPLRFHDLRHTFGTLAVRRAEVLAVQAWMGHADIQTTMRYVNHRDRGDEAKLLAQAFAVADPARAVRLPS